MPGSQLSEWFVCFPQDSPARLRLFCFPYAGGSAWAFRSWPEWLPAGVEVLGIQLPGRGHRSNQKLLTSLQCVVEGASEAIAPLLDRPFAFFGHSLGALICFETARYLRSRQGVMAGRLFVSGRHPPHVDSASRSVHELPDAEFLGEVQKLNGLPAEVIANPELQRLVLPALRADFYIAETHQSHWEPPLDCPITAYGGSRDADVPEQSLQKWSQCTNGQFSLEMFPGDHFFIHSDERRLLRSVGHHLQGLLSTVPATFTHARIN